MHVTKRIHLLGLVALISVLSGLALAWWAMSGLTYYYYFDQDKSSLSLDVNRIAFASEDSTIANDFNFAGYSWADVKPGPFQNWYYLETKWHDRASGRIETLVERMAQENEIEFVSPVFFGAGQSQVFFTGQVLLTTPNGEKASDLKLDNLGEAVLVSDPQRPEPERAIIANAGKNGFAILQLANRLNDAPGVKISLPSMAITGDVMAEPTP